LSREVCRNPFADEPCRNTDIAVVLYINGEYYPVCHSCWLEIAESNIEWSSSEANIKTPVRMMKSRMCLTDNPECSCSTSPARPTRGETEVM